MGPSSLNVLIVCNSQNILLYASRFQLAKSIQLYHITSSKSSNFEIETFNYGHEQVEMKNCHSSIEDMIEKNEKLTFDLVLMSANSLQEISSISSQMNSVINSNTKIIIESSGFIQLEPFVRMSIDIPASNVFSIISDFDIREIEANKFKQFPNSNSTLTNTLFLGATSTDNAASVNGKYSKNVVTLLETFERLFKKLFPHDSIDLCNYTERDFLSQQWIFALPKICFDSLLIILDETVPKKLTNQILAKPLISGLVTELVAIAKSMGAKLPSSMNTESSLINYWENLYPKENDIPSLVFNFLNRLSSLNIDILLLQPILLADDNGIKTPYLEFLYSVFCQYEKINKGESKWFMRVEDFKSSRNKLDNLSSEKESLKREISKLTQSLEAKDRELTMVKNMELQSKNEVNVLQREVQSLKTELANQSRTYKNELSELLKLQNQQQLQQRDHLERLENQTINTFDSNEQNSKNTQPQSSQYTSTGTPLINDFEDLAIYAYDSPTKDHINSKNRQSIMPPSRSFNKSQSNSPVTSLEEISSSSNGNDSLQRKELELKKKELELQERELEFQKRTMQQQQRQMMSTPVNNGPPNMNLSMNGQHNQFYSSNNSSRKPSHTQLQQPVNTRPNRSMYGASNSSGNFVDPVAGGMASGMQGNIGNFQSHQGIKPTSRKNRNSTMPSLGHASSLGLSGMSNGQNNNPNNGPNQPRITSLSMTNLPNQNRPRQLQTPVHSQQPASFNNTNRINMPRATKANSFMIGSQQLGGNLNQEYQRQTSGSTYDGNSIQNNNNINPNISMSSVVHNPINLNNNVVNNSSNNSTMPQHASVPQLNAASATPPLTQLNAPSATPPLTQPIASFGAESPQDTSSDNEKAPEKKKKFKLFGRKK